MKKFIIFLILAMVFAVSCGGSKQNGNDADILPDKDVNDTDEESGDSDEYDNDTDILPDEDATDADENDEDNDDEPDESSDTDEENPCDPNPCENFANTDGTCTGKGLKGFECGCVEGYFWDGVKCVSPCDPNPCKNDKNSTGKCTPSTFELYECSCNKGYFWNGKNCVDPCEGISCNQFNHASGTCKPEDAFYFVCECAESYYWWGKDKGCIEQKPTAVNVCTGQNKCYDNGKEILCPAENEEFFGQDAQYARLGYCVPQSFSIDNSVEDEPVVIDNNLGLMWQRKIPPLEEHYIEGVLQYCEDLVYGGYDDWRLPTMEDFLSIADYGKYPALDTKYFPDSGKFWTATIENDSFIWVAYPTYQRLSIIFDFNRPAISDVITYEADYYDNSHKTYSYSFKIRCVRGNYITWGNTYDLIFTRTKTANTWREALQYCSELDYAGISDWRVPNVKELIMNSLDGFHSSTTKISDPAFDHKYEKNEILENTLCVANDPCGKGKFWNGEKCVKNPCADNPCGSEDALNKICKPIDEEKYFCGCSKCMYEEHSNGKCFEDMVGGIDCYCDSGYFWDEYSDKCLSD